MQILLPRLTLAFVRYLLPHLGHLKTLIVIAQLLSSSGSLVSWIQNQRISIFFIEEGLLERN
jgi:hypothetical protein